MKKSRGFGIGWKEERLITVSISKFDGFRFRTRFGVTRINAESEGEK